MSQVLQISTFKHFGIMAYMKAFPVFLLMPAMLWCPFANITTPTTELSNGVVLF